MEWCGHQGYLFLASSYFDSKQKIDYLESKCANLESFVATETSTVTNLRKILKQSQRTAEDTEWQLQEQLAHTNNLLINEREVNLDLKQEISLLQNKLVEVETFMDSDSGKLLLQFEEELAVSKLRIAELEEEKDCLELQVRNRKPLSRKDPNML